MQSHKRLFRGWYVVAAATAGIGCSAAVLVTTLTGIFARPLAAELGWSTQQVFLGSSLNGIGALFVAPLVGRLADRHGARRIAIWSFILQGVVVFSFRYLDGGLAGYLLRYVALAILCTGTTQVVFTRVVTAWFERHVGLAIGIAYSGVGLGGAVWSLVAQRLIEHVGWRDAYAGIAILITVFMLPLLLLVIRDSPRSLGLAMDGDPVDPAGPPRASATWDGITLGAAARTRIYWQMIITALLLGLALQSVQFHMVPLLLSHQLSFATAASIQASMWIAVMAGRISCGWLVDRFHAPRVAQSFLIAPLVGVALLATADTPDLLLPAAIMVGFAIGSEYGIFAFLVSRYFGRAHYSSIYGTFFSTFATAGALGPMAAAWAVDRTSARYSLVLWTSFAVLCTAAVLLSTFPRYRSRSAGA